MFFLCNFLVAWFVYPNDAGDYKMASKNKNVSNGFPTSMEMVPLRSPLTYFPLLYRYSSVRCLMVNKRRVESP